MNQAFYNLLERLVLFGGAVAFLAVLAGSVLLSLCLLRPASRRAAWPAYGDTELLASRSSWLVRTLAVFLGGTLLLFSSLWWIGRVATRLGRPSPRLQTALIDPDPWAVRLFPWD